MKIIDSHCHLEMCEEVESALALSAETYYLYGAHTIGTKWSERQVQQALIKKYAQSPVKIWASIGTHPNHVTQEKLPSLEEMLKALNQSGIIGVGETGLDYFRNTEETKDLQLNSFRRHIEAAREAALPVIIHCRNAGEDVLSILEEERLKGHFSFLIHCFAEDMDFAKRIEALGGYISFSGLLTFPKCDPIREVAEYFPLDRILIETDSPFLAPVPKRGKKNIPGWTYFVAEYLAKIRGLSTEMIAEQTCKNFFNLFPKALSQ